MDISYSKYSVYQKCPKQYLFMVLRSPKVERDGRDAVTGTAVQKVMEIFYNNRIYDPQHNVSIRGVPLSEMWGIIEDWMKAEIINQHEVAVRNALSKGQPVKYTASQFKQQLQSYHEQFALIISSIKKHKLLSNDVWAERYMAANILNDRIAGSVDFVIKRGAEVRILDGKNTRRGLKYLEKDQLLWYTLLYHKNQKRWPDELGWWLFRTGEVVWVDWNPKDVAQLEEKIKTLLVRIRHEALELKRRNLVGADLLNVPDLFVAKTGSDSCRFCSYKNSCKSYQEWSAEKRLRVKIPDMDGGIADIDIGGSGGGMVGAGDTEEDAGDNG